jgi:hypothetical protein
MSAAGIDLASYSSAHTLALKALAVKGQPSIDPWAASYRAVNNFAHHVERITHDQSSLGGSGSAEMKFKIDNTTLGDLAIGAYLQIELPKLVGSATDSPSWVWGLGFAMIEYIRFSIGQDLETLYGDYLEIQSELHAPPSLTFQNVLKLDNVTQPELAAISQTGGNVLYVPLSFFWTRGSHCLLPIEMLKRQSKDCTIEVHFRELSHLVVNLPLDSTGSADSSHLGVLPQAVSATDTSGTQSALSWSQFKVELYLETVILEKGTPEFAKLCEGAQGGYTALATTSKSLYTSTGADSNSTPFENGTVDETNLTLAHPVKALIWAIRDKKAISRTGLQDHANPFNGENSVRKLFGTKASHKTDSTADGTNSGTPIHIIDYNVRREGAKVGVNRQTTSTNTADGDNDADIMTSGDVKVHRNDGENGCLHLIGNRFDYRTVDSSGVEVEPLKSIQLKLANQNRWNQDLSTTGAYFRTVQPLSYANKVPRKGIYMYSFALNASSPLPTGSANLSRIYNKALTVQTNSTGSDSEPRLLFFSEFHNVFEVASPLDSSKATGFRYI